MQPQPLVVILQTETSSNDKQDKIKLCKHESHESLFISEIGKYIVSFFLDDRGLELSLLN